MLWLSPTQQLKSSAQAEGWEMCCRHVPARKSEHRARWRAQIPTWYEAVYRFEPKHSEKHNRKAMSSSMIITQALM